MGTAAGLVLAAGAGTRFGGPKALAVGADGTPWIASAVRALQDGGCGAVVVVLGAAAEQARAMVPAGSRGVVAEDWRAGVAASLRAGLDALPDADAVVITLVDLPGLPAAAVARVLAAAPGPAGLARAVYSGAPGHPVVLGRDRLAPFRESLRGDEGGRAWLHQHGAVPVECGDLFTGADVDRR